jgi:hypothetical protein
MVGAAIVGAVVGSFLASKLMSKPKTKVEVVRETAKDVSTAAADQASAVVDQAIAIARAAAEQMARRAPSRDDLASGAARLTDVIRSSGSRLADEAAPTISEVKRSGRAAYAAQLVPLTVELLKNPIVRDLLIRGALQAANRRKK